jgi:hypothetical protein
VRRRAAVVLAAGVGLAAAWPSLAAEAPPQVLYRASASATAVHGFYDHEGLFPVPLLNVSVPHAEASIEPGPSSSALGSFLWDPEVAELGTILCVLSEGGFCEFPDYPFQARASYPASGQEDAPPTLASNRSATLCLAAFDSASRTTCSTSGTSISGTCLSIPACTSSVGRTSALTSNSRASSATPRDRPSAAASWGRSRKM